MKSQYVFNPKQPIIMAMFIATAILLCAFGEQARIGANALLVSIIILLFVCGFAVLGIKATVAASDEKIIIEHYVLNRKIYEYDIPMSKIRRAECETEVKTATLTTVYMHTLRIELKNGRCKCFSASFVNKDGGKAFDENSDEYKTIVEYHMLTRICNFINDRLS